MIEPEKNRFTVAPTSAQILAGDILQEVRTIVSSLPADPQNLKINNVEFKLKERQMIDLDLGDGRTITFSIWGQKRVGNA